MDVQATEAKAKLSELLRRAEAGETVRITRRGEVVARLLPPVPTEGEERAARAAALKRIRDRRSRMPALDDTQEEIKRMARADLA